MPLRLIFMGTPDFAVPTLRALHDEGHEILAVYTREPKPAGRRGLTLQPTPVEQEARRRALPVLTPKSLKMFEAIAQFRFHEADAVVVVAYGMILPQAILDAPKLGCFNLHASLLPRWRGAAPINRAIMAGDAKTGVMVMKMDAGLDTGDIVRLKAKSVVKITNSTTAGDLHDQLAQLGANLMSLAMRKLSKRKPLRIVKQPDPPEPLYARKIDKNETRIDWSKPARDVLKHIHGLSPSPGAWSEIPTDGGLVRVKILQCRTASGKGNPGTLLDDSLRVACKDRSVRILRLQRSGREPMTAEDFLRGAKLKAGIHLT
ncbi:MAG: methionyl-tRNA formyltransferase [Bradyrhizobium sp.]